MCAAKTRALGAPIDAASSSKGCSAPFCGVNAADGPVAAPSGMLPASRHAPGPLAPRPEPPAGNGVANGHSNGHANGNGHSNGHSNGNGAHANGSHAAAAADAALPKKIKVANPVVDLDGDEMTRWVGGVEAPGGPQWAHAAAVASPGSPHDARPGRRAWHGRARRRWRRRWARAARARAPPSPRLRRRHRRPPPGSSGT